MLPVSRMRLPDRIDTSTQPVSLVCPDCGGALSVRAEGAAEYLLFVCQVGHSYSATTLLSEKEERLEEVLWSGVYLLEELADLLADLGTRGGLDGGHPIWPAARRRTERLRDQATRLRRLLDDNEPIDLGHGVPSERA
jgi:two-component system, chemotaxis family, protein-glutamate methylesterase/glutaminase